MGKWHDLVAALKEQCPTKNRRVVVRRIHMRDHGSTRLSENERTITVSVRKQDPLPMQLDTLVHEWGHVLEDDAYVSHGKQWGEFQARAYKVLEELRLNRSLS